MVLTQRLLDNLYDSFFNLKYTMMFTSKPSLGFSIFGIYHDLKYWREYNLTPKTQFWYIKKCILKSLPYIEKRGNDFEGAYVQTVSQNKHRNQASHLGVESENVKKEFPPKRWIILYDSHFQRKMRNRHLSTVVYNVMKCDFEYHQSRWKCNHSKLVLFWGYRIIMLVPKGVGLFDNNT